MKEVRIIPCLDVKDGRVVKGVRFENVRDARDPVEAAEAYCREGADELVFLDIAATVEARGTRLDWVRRVAEKVTVPLCIGGGIRNMKDMKALFDLGVDRISVNTAAVRDPELIANASRQFGKSRLVVAIDGRKNSPGSALPRLEVVVRGGHDSIGIELVGWARRVEELGAGEILLTSKDADGTREGYDIEMTKAVAEAISIPVVASGGAGKLEHLYEAVAVAGASAVLAASIFHFGEISILQAKEYLRSKGIPIRV